MQKLDPLTLTAILDAMVLKPFSGMKSARATTTSRHQPPSAGRLRARATKKNSAPTQSI